MGTRDTLARFWAQASTTAPRSQMAEALAGEAYAAPRRVAGVPRRAPGRTAEHTAPRPEPVPVPSAVAGAQAPAGASGRRPGRKAARVPWLAGARRLTACAVAVAAWLLGLVRALGRALLRPAARMLARRRPLRAALWALCALSVVSAVGAPVLALAALALAAHGLASGRAAAQAPAPPRAGA